MHSTSFWAAEVPDPGSEYILQTKYFPEYYCISPDWLAAYAHICLLSVVSVSLYTPDNKKTYAHCKKTALHFSLYAISQMQTKYLSHENNRITRFRNFFNFFQNSLTIFEMAQYVYCKDKHVPYKWYMDWNLHCIITENAWKLTEV